MRIAIVTQRKEALTAFAVGLSAQGITIDWLPGPREAVEQACIIPRAMVILDDPLGVFREPLSDLMEANALLHTAVITAMEPEAFHEASEGLGVLCALPPSPNGEHARQLLATLKNVQGA